MIGRKIKGIALALAGVVSTLLGFIGLICPCTFPTLAAILGFLSISSVFLSKYHVLFLFAGVAFLSLSVIYLVWSKKEKKCKAD